MGPSEVPFKYFAELKSFYYISTILLPYFPAACTRIRKRILIILKLKDNVKQKQQRSRNRNHVLPVRDDFICHRSPEPYGCHRKDPVRCDQCNVPARQPRQLHRLCLHGPSCRNDTQEVRLQGDLSRSRGSRIHRSGNLVPFRSR